MKVPQGIVLFLALAGFFLAEGHAHAASPKASSKVASGKAKKTQKALAMARKADSLAQLALARKADSTARADSTRRVDSLRVVADSIRRVDSAAAAARTWFVARPRGDFLSDGFSVRLQERSEIELRRTGRVRIAAGGNPNSSDTGIWNAARASGAGKLLFQSIQGSALGASKPVAGVSNFARVFDVASGSELDSTLVQVSDFSDRATVGLARDVVRRLLPTSADSACRADSTLQVNRIWAVAPVRGDGPDSVAARTVEKMFVDGLRESDRATWMSTSFPEGCSSPRCLDSAALAAGAALVLHSQLERRADSTWILSVRIVRSGDDSLVDSLRATDLDPSRLVSRVLPDMLPPPPSCGRSCVRASARDLWTFSLRSDSSLDVRRRELARDLKIAFRARKDRQFLSLRDSAAPGSLDSLARSLGAGKIAVARLSGSDSFWILTAHIRDLRSGRSDTQVLLRGGPHARVFPWFSRHVAAWGAKDDPCGNSCRKDSLRREAETWAVVPPAASDSGAIQPLGALVQAFSGRRHGRIDSLGSIPCRNLLCLDSLAASRSIGKLLWPSFARGKDSSWIMDAWTSDVASDSWLDTVQVKDTGTLDQAMARMSRKVWDSVAPVHVCDTCVSTDTLEAALAVSNVQWNGGPDSVGKAFRDTLARVIARESSFYQVLERNASDRYPPGLAVDSSARQRLHCRTGAVYVLGSQVSRDSLGWHVKASLMEATTGKVVKSLDYLDKDTLSGRPIELAAWTARHILGTDTTAIAPRHPGRVPWWKIIKLGIPALVGICSVILRW